MKTISAKEFIDLYESGKEQLLDGLLDGKLQVDPDEVSIKSRYHWSGLFPFIHREGYIEVSDGKRTLEVF